LTLFFTQWSATFAGGYSFNEIVPDVREPAGVSGGSACPLPSRQLTSPAAIAFRWSTVLGNNPTTILTQDQTAAGRLNEIEQAIQQSLSVWSNVSGTALTSASFAPSPASPPATSAAPMASTPSASIKRTRPSLPASLPSPGSSPPIRSASNSAAARPPPKSVKSSTPTFISIPAIRWSPLPRPPLSPPTRRPTTSNPFLPTNSATRSASATPPSGAQ